MEIENYNIKARESLGKQYMDISTALIKGGIFLITIIPVTLFMKNIFDGNISKITFDKVFQFMSNDGIIIILFELCVLFILIFAVKIRNIGLEHIHKAEELHIKK